MGVSAGLPQSFFCESEREKVHDDRGNTLSVGKGKKESTILFVVFTANYWDCLKHLHLLSAPQPGWEHRRPRQNLFMAFNRIPRW